MITICFFKPMDRASVVCLCSVSFVDRRLYLGPHILRIAVGMEVDQHLCRVETVYRKKIKKICITNR